MAAVEAKGGFVVGADHEVDDFDIRLCVQPVEGGGEQGGAGALPAGLGAHAHVQVGGMPQLARAARLDEQEAEESGCAARNEKQGPGPPVQVAQKAGERLRGRKFVVEIDGEGVGGFMDVAEEPAGILRGQGKAVLDRIEHFHPFCSRFVYCIGPAHCLKIHDTGEGAGTGG